jgi:chemotaxis signal transduction protein
VSRGAPGPPPLHALFWRSAGRALLLPVGAVAEVVRVSRPRPLASGPDLALGWIEWRGRPLPVVALPPSPPSAQEVMARRARYLICVGPSGGRGADLFALWAAEQPRLVSIEARALEPQPPGTAPPGPALSLARFYYRGEATAVPDLAALEDMLGRSVIGESHPTAPE